MKPTRGDDLYETENAIADRSLCPPAEKHAIADRMLATRDGTNATSDRIDATRHRMNAIRHRMRQLPELGEGFTASRSCTA